MKITHGDIFEVTLPIKGGSYRRAGALTAPGNSSAILRVQTDAGPTKARRIHDPALDLGISVVADDNRGSETVSASPAHFAQSTDPKYLLNTTDLTDYVTLSTAIGFAGREAGTLRAGRAPGLDVTLRDSIAVTPVKTVSQGDAS